MKKPANFILIDDEPIANILSEIIIKRIFPDAKISAFLIPTDGIEYVKTECVSKQIKSVLFLDINMPGLSGWDVLDRIEKMPEKNRGLLTIYMLSSSIDIADKMKVKSYGFVTNYIEKPLNETKLQSIFS